LDKVDPSKISKKFEGTRKQPVKKEQIFLRLEDHQKMRTVWQVKSPRRIPSMFEVAAQSSW
jgi:hypothetical protein